MKILDRYLLKKFLTSYVFVVFVLVLVICVIDFTDKNDNFLKTNPPWSAVLFDYYFNLFPYWANMLSPITTFIAVVFVTARLASHTEITAMLSSGISFKRIMVPYLMGAVIIGGMIFWLTGWVIPNANKTRVAFEIQYTKNPYYFDGRDIHVKVAPTTYVYLESYNNTIDVGYQFTMEEIDSLKLKQKLKAKKISWDKEKEKWHIDDYSVHTFRGDQEDITYGNAIDTTINLQPKDFASTYGLQETLTLTELDEYINELKSRGADNIATYEIEKAQRYTSPFAIVILTIIGVIVSARKTREGAGFQIALGFFLAFVYIIFFLTSRSIAQGGSISPYMATWIPNIVFGGVGLILYRYVPR
ncbi:lipopolysaccharide export system permease protein [Catalinimonas alkaloidigena]|uniref:Lipopolysaccharide export system permease protein n=1 Tax=Catalinimonas alkaloidigena TaxID=1075417 RepID=A0A1G9UA97_9BACT|nr:LptF/LptG family permease [Catalinimonas alkaloidigena]SDM56818.1 lipopolysaccharide export system permease protein [Catalinimonas alkaloidigena]